MTAQPVQVGQPAKYVEAKPADVYTYIETLSPTEAIDFIYESVNENFTKLKPQYQPVLEDIEGFIWGCRRAGMTNEQIVKELTEDRFEY